MATGIAAAIVINISGLMVYGTSFFARHFSMVGDNKTLWMVVAACLAAFAGSIIGRRVLKKITMRTVQLTVGLLILAMGVLLGMGVV